MFLPLTITLSETEQRQRLVYTYQIPGPEIWQVILTATFA
jgi:hypothetical protein